MDQNLCGEEQPEKSDGGMFADQLPGAKVGP